MHILVFNGSKLLLSISQFIPLSFALWDREVPTETTGRTDQCNIVCEVHTSRLREHLNQCSTQNINSDNPSLKKNNPYWAVTQLFHARSSVPTYFKTCLEVKEVLPFKGVFYSGWNSREMTSTLVTQLGSQPTSNLGCLCWHGCFRRWSLWHRGVCSCLGSKFFLTVSAWSKI